MYQKFRPLIYMTESECEKKMPMFSPVSSKEEKNYKQGYCYHHSYHLFHKFNKSKKGPKPQIAKGYRYRKDKKYYEKTFHYWVEVGDTIWDINFIDKHYRIEEGLKIYHPYYTCWDRNHFLNKYKFKFVDFVDEIDYIKPTGNEKYTSILDPGVLYKNIDYSIR